ncbi:MAG: phycobilisome linker polypeptide [Phormidesmis sp.]
MLGQRFAGAAADSRIFIYEVTGLHQNEVTQYQSNPIRSSDSQFIQVPFNRMSEVMQRITTMQGKIVNIFPLEEQPTRIGASVVAEPATTEAAESAASEA